MQNAIVTGAAGLYGLAIVDRLVRDPHVKRVIGVDNKSRPFLVKDPFTCIESDELNEKFVFEEKNFQDITPEEIDINNIDTVIHLAASISIPESMESITKQNMYHYNNTGGTLKLLQSLLESQNHPLIIYASSPEVYGNPVYVPMDEGHPLNPRSIYAASKVAAEKYIYAYEEWHGYPAVIVRNFNTFGPNQNVWRDAAVITNFTCKALKNEPIIIHGDGMQTRDFQYVEDAANAYYKIAKVGKELAGSVFNIGTGVQTSIRSLAEIIVDITNSRSEIIHKEGRSADLLALEANCSNIRKMTGWQPQYSLRQGLERSIPWYDCVLCGRFQPVVYDYANGGK